MILFQVRFKQILKVIDDTNQVIVVMSSPIGYPQDLVFYEVQKKYELANQFLVELSHFRSCDDVVPSPVPSQSGRQSHAAFPIWALIRKPAEPVSAHPTYVDVINNEWVISFSAIVGFHERNTLDQWMQLGFVITKDKTFFRKQNDEKMYAVSVSINVALINSNIVCGACGIIRNYLAQALGAQYKGISPYFQIFVGQLPASLLLTLSTQIDRKDFEVLESYTICSCPGIHRSSTYIERVLAKAASHNVWAAFIRQFLVLRASPLQYQALINALRLECVDLPESIGKGAIKFVPDKVYFLVT